MGGLGIKGERGRVHAGLQPQQMSPEDRVALSGATRMSLLPLLSPPPTMLMMLYNYKATGK